MSSYGKVTYVEDDNLTQETVVEENTNVSTIDSQVSKFDNSYSTQKLQDLYDEYDKITIDEEKVKSIIQTKTNAIEKTNSVTFRQIVLLSASIIVAVLMAVLCIYNISVINGTTTSINYLQEEVMAYAADLSVAETNYNSLTNTENVMEELSNLGYSEIPSSNIVAVNVPEKVEVELLQAETNWFDAVCNFLSQIFG